MVICIGKDCLGSMSLSRHGCFQHMASSRVTARHSHPSEQAWLKDMLHVMGYNNDELWIGCEKRASTFGIVQQEEQEQFQRNTSS